MKTMPILTIAIVAVAMLAAGCCWAVPAGPAPSPSPGSKVVHATTMDEIDAALERGPVLIKLGSTSCPACVDMIPVLEDLSIRYPGITVMDIDIYEARDITKSFYIYYIPQTDIIVRKNGDGTYQYVGLDGKPGNDVIGTRIVGFVDADALQKPLDAALALRNRS